MASFELQEEVQSLIEDSTNYEITNEHNISAMDERAAIGLLESAYWQHIDGKLF